MVSNRACPSRVRARPIHWTPAQEKTVSIRLMTHFQGDPLSRIFRSNRLRFRMRGAMRVQTRPNTLRREAGPPVSQPPKQNNDKQAYVFYVVYARCYSNCLHFTAKHQSNCHANMLAHLSI